MPKIQNIPQPLPLAKMAYHALREAILTGRLNNVEVYNEVALAKGLGISRTPVREALLELASQGLINFLPRRGVAVVRFSAQDVEEIFELRKAIELAAIEKVSRANPRPDFRKAAAALKDQQMACHKKNATAFMLADRKFHGVFFRLTDNRRMIAIMENIRDVLHVMGLQAMTVEGRMAQVLTEHAAVLEAAGQGNTAAAINALDRHLEQSKQAVLERAPAMGTANNRQD